MQNVKKIEKLSKKLSASTLNSSEDKKSYVNIYFRLHIKQKFLFNDEH